MTHGSLFSGIGGFDLASEWMGWDNLFHCEWNEFGQKVLKHYWPEAELFIDIKKSNFTKYANKIDVLTGGFPCQPYSSAGKRLGKEDDRHLWPEMLRAIREIQPRYVVGENVSGLTNWNGGLVFDEVQADLEAEGYEVLPFLLPACAINAPHRRDRIWFIAYSISASKRANELRSLRFKNGEISGERTQTIYDAIGPNGTSGITSDTNSNGQYECDSEHEINTSEARINALSNINEGNVNGNVADTKSTRSTIGKLGKPKSKKQVKTGCNINGFKSMGNATDTTNIGRTNALENGQMERGRSWKSNQRNTWDTFPSVTPICVGDDGLSNRLDNITFPKWRNESIKAGGNAIVPQVAYQIFKAINELEKLNNEFQR
jgi:DNA (cytosine-5)-methyltransferase 1